VLCLQETKVQDQEFPAEEIKNAGYAPSFRGMKGYNGVATLTRVLPDRVIHGLHEGPDNEDFRVIQTVVAGIPIIDSYVSQGYSITSEKYAFKLAWFRRLRAYFESALSPEVPAIWVGDLNVAPEPIDVYHPERRVNDADFLPAASHDQWPMKPLPERAPIVKPAPVPDRYVDLREREKQSTAFASRTIPNILRYKPSDEYILS
jgi:exodeoxyribonuclease-3